MSSRPVTISSLINEIIETGGPIFITGSPRFTVPQDQVSVQAPFTSSQLSALSAFVYTRDERNQCIHFIRHRLHQSSLALLYGVLTGTPVVDPVVRSQLVVCVLVCWMAYYASSPCRLQFRHVTVIQNVLLSGRVHSEACFFISHTDCSLMTSTGLELDLSDLPVFHS